MTDQGPGQVAVLVARFLRERGVDRVFGLQGGHIQPIWDQLARGGTPIVDVRDEGAAVHMAHAHSELTGQTGVALATAGPGVTNTVTAMANASVSRIPLVLIGGCAPRPQANMGPLQGIAHVEILRPVTRLSRALNSADQVLRELDEAWARAAGDRGEPGPVYVEIPTDVLRESVPPALVTAEHLRPKARRRSLPHPATFRRVPYGAEGTPVYTHLERTSQPMIRLASGDLTRWVMEENPCGRTYPRLPEGVYGRIDDMIHIRGENVYPIEVDNFLRGLAGYAGEHQIVVTRTGSMDEMTVRAECSSAGADREEFARAGREGLQTVLGVRVTFEPVDPHTFVRAEHKSRRVVDQRDHLRR